MQKLPVKCVLISFVMMFSSNASSELYKWVDDDGNVHYTQKKPASDFEVIKPPPTIKKDQSAATDANGGPIIVDSEEEAKRLEMERNKKIQEVQNVDDENEKIAAENEKIKESNCENSKVNMKKLTATERIRLKGEDGVVRWASVEQRQAQIDKIQSNIDKWCN